MDDDQQNITPRPSAKRRRQLRHDARRASMTPMQTVRRRIDLAMPAISKAVAIVTPCLLATVTYFALKVFDHDMRLGVHANEIQTLQKKDDSLDKADDQAREERKAIIQALSQAISQARVEQREFERDVRTDLLEIRNQLRNIR